MTDAALANDLPAAGFATLLLLFLLFLIGFRVKWGLAIPVKTAAKAD